MKKPLTLRVRPNPFHALDGDGMPAGIARLDPAVGRPNTIEFIGVTVSKDPIRDPENLKREPRYQRRTTTLVWAQGAVEIPITDMHKQYVRSGALIADDKATAQECKIWFVEPALVLAQAKKKAIAEWLTHHDEPPPVEAWDAAVGPPAPAAPPKAPDELPLLRPWDAPIEKGASAPKVN